MTNKKEHKEPFTLKINFEINSDTIKKLWNKTKGKIIIFGAGGTIVHGTIDPNFYFDILKQFGNLLLGFFK